MCLGIPGKVTKVSAKTATVSYPGQTREVMLAGEKVKVGDWVLVQMGIAVKKLSKEEIKSRERPEQAS